MDVLSVMLILVCVYYVIDNIIIIKMGLVLSIPSPIASTNLAIHV